MKNLKKKRSEYMKSLNPEEQGRRSKKGWDNSTIERYIERCNIAAENWTEERRENQSVKLKEYYKNNPEEISQRTQLTWDSKSEEEREEFRKKNARS